MLGGDISNKSAPIVAFNIDELLFTSKSTESLSFFEKLKLKTMGDKQKYLNRPLSKDFITIINNLWSKYTFSIYLITFRVDAVDELYEILSANNVCYTSLVPIEDKKELRKACELQYAYYFDVDLDLLSFIGQRSAMHMKDLSTVLR
jgi:hypothetical protein